MGRKKWGFLEGGEKGGEEADRMKRSWGPIEMLRKWPSFSPPRVAQG